MSLFINVHNEKEPQIKLTVEKLIEFVTKNLSHIEDNTITTYAPEEVKETVTIMPQNVVKILSNLNLPQSLNKILNGYELSRIGVLKHDDTNTDISLYTSILTCIKSNFRSQLHNTQKAYVTQLNQNLISFINNKFIDFKYKDMKWNRTEVIAQIKEYKQTKTILKVFGDYLHTNIILIDFENDSINCVDELSPFRKTIILSLIDGDNFEPISYKNSFLLEPQSELIQYLSTITLTTFAPIDNELDKYIKTNTDQYQGLSMQDRVILRAIKSEFSKVYEKEPSTEPLKYTEKMKLDELQNDAKKYGIDLVFNGKRKTKLQLANELNEKIINSNNTKDLNKTQ